jgi:small subunit ribosomal protein S6
MEFKAEGNIIADYELAYKRDERIIRFVTLALDKHAIIYNERKRNEKIKKAQATA